MLYRGDIMNLTNKSKINSGEIILLLVINIGYLGLSFFFMVIITFIFDLIKETIFLRYSVWQIMILIIQFLLPIIILAIINSIIHKKKKLVITAGLISIIGILIINILFTWFIYNILDFTALIEIIPYIFWNITPVGTYLLITYLVFSIKNKEKNLDQDHKKEMEGIVN